VLLTPFFGRPVQQYVLAAILISIGVVVALLTALATRRWGKRRVGDERSPEFSDTR
jgi:basic amino acid/polyamine antiporter, APA family